MGHLGARVSALLDGQLSAGEAERCWEHVHGCHACRDLVEREGAIKTRLAGLSLGDGGAPDHLKGSLLGTPPLGSRDPFAAFESSQPRRHVGGVGTVGLVAMGGGAVGAAFIGVLALGIAPADAPVDRKPPVTNIGRHSEAPRLGPFVPVGTRSTVRTP